MLIHGLCYTVCVSRRSISIKRTAIRILFHYQTMESLKFNYQSFKKLSKEDKHEKYKDDLELKARILADTSPTHEVFKKEIVEAYRNEMRAICFKNFGNTLRDDNVDDILQNVLIRIFRNLESFNGESSLSRWMSIIVVNECRSFLRKKNRIVDRNTVSLDEPGYVDFADKDSFAKHESKGEIFISYLLENEELLSEIIGKEHVRRKKIFLMSYKEDMSNKEISKEINKKESYVRGALTRARDSIREYLKDEKNQEFLKSI